MNTQDSIKSTGTWEVKRKMKIPGLLHATNAEVVEHSLSQLSGVQKVISDVEKHQVTIRYDASRIDYAGIEKLLKDAGFPPLNNSWSRFKKNLYQFTDTNARNNANAPTRPCCNRPPK